MGLVKIVLAIVGSFLLAAIGFAAFLWITDYEVQATITEKQGDVITIRPKIIPRDFQYALDSQSAQFVCEGYQVTYAIRSGHYIVYDLDGEPIYDSATGKADTLRATRCAVLGA